MVQAGYPNQIGGWGLNSHRVRRVGLEPTMPEGDGVTARCDTNSAHRRKKSHFIYPIDSVLRRAERLLSNIYTPYTQ